MNTCKICKGKDMSRLKNGYCIFCIFFLILLKPELLTKEDNQK